MNAVVNRKDVRKNYTFLAVMVGSMVLGAAAGWIFPAVRNSSGDIISPGASVLKPLGTVFINLMFCVVVPMVFSSISSAVANMKSRRRAGKIMGITIATFVVTGAIAAVIMFLLMRTFPPVLTPWPQSELLSEDVGAYASLSDMLVNFFTAPDFVGLLSRKVLSMNGKRGNQ